MLAEGRLRVPQDPREARLVAGLGPGALADRAVADLLDEAREPVLGLAAVREADPSEVLDSLADERVDGRSAVSVAIFSWSSSISACASESFSLESFIAPRAFVAAALSRFAAASAARARAAICALRSRRRWTFVSRWSASARRSSMAALACLFLCAIASCFIRDGRRNSQDADGDTFGSSTSVRARLWFRNGDSSCTGAGAGVALIRAIFSPMRITMVASSATSPFLNEAVTSFPPGSLK